MPIIICGVKVISFNPCAVFLLQQHCKYLFFSPVLLESNDWFMYDILGAKLKRLPAYTWHGP